MSSSTKLHTQPSDSPALSPRRLYWQNDLRYIVVTLTVIILAGLALRTYELSARSLWFDEAFAWRLTQFPFAEMIQCVGQDNHPPLYFILLKAWAAVFGDSAFALRSLSVLFGVLTILGTYLFAVEVFDDKSDGLRKRGQGIGLLAAAFVALSAFQIRYSWEMRMYALATALAVFSSWALFRALRPPSRLHRWLQYGIFALLLAATHYYALFTLAAQAIFVAAVLLTQAEWNFRTVLRNQHFRHALLTAILVMLACLPWLPVFLRQRAQVRETFWTHPVTRWDAAELCYWIFVAPEAFSSAPRSVQLLSADVCLLGLYMLWRKARMAEWYILWSATAPLLFCLLASEFRLHVFTPRYFIIAHVFLLIGLATLVWRIPRRLERNIVAVVLLVFFVGIYVDYWRDLDIEHKPGAQGAAAFLQEQRRPGEPVIVCMPRFYFSLLHYAKDRRDYHLYSDGRPMPHHYGTAAMIPEDLITDEQLRTLRSRRVWVVDMAGGNMGFHAVPVPSEWVVKERRVFSDLVGVGDVIVLRYDTSGGTGGNPAAEERRSP